MPTKPRRRWELWLLAAVALAIGFAFWEPPEDVARHVDAPTATSRPTFGRGTGRSHAEAPPSAGHAAPIRPEKASDEDCPPNATSACARGDVYWFDGCGAPGDKKQECGVSLCRDGACMPQNERACRDLPLEGRCDGDVVRGCVGGQPYEVDCGALGKRCVKTHEGSGCHVPTKADCAIHRPPRCVGNDLVGCRDGRKVRIRCADRGGACGHPAGQQGAVCFRVETLASAPAPNSRCGACGCPENAVPGSDVCDGLDNDEDGRIDEGGKCAPVDVVAFVIADVNGESSYADEDVEREIERINRTFASGDHGLGTRVELADTVVLSNRAWLDLDDREFQEMIWDDVLTLEREEFFIPLIFTDRVSVHDATKAGKSTLPNGRCGGRRVTDHPGIADGAIAIAKGRAPTTAAHEIGHYLGLCHTHFGFDDTMHRVVEFTDGDGQLVQQSCAPLCVGDGDGMCDTPEDPGPGRCTYDQTCAVGCRHGERPDPFNVMSYYTACRYTLSEMQALEMRRTLAMRRGWRPCREAGSCPCDPTDNHCPDGMVCQPPGEGEGGVWACALEGPRAKDDHCDHHRDCATGLCRKGRCASLE